jgi:hypothetical protein
LKDKNVCLRISSSLILVEREKQDIRESSEIDVVAEMLNV